MNVVVIGLGSMGKRRIRLLHKNHKHVTVFGIDYSEQRRVACSKEYGIETYESLESVLSMNNIEAAFICTSPLSHHKIIAQCLEQNIHVFTELNLVADGYDSNMKLANEKNVVLFLSSTFIYREEIKKIKEIVKDIKGKLNYSYHIGQYLPDWHPWESYKDFFVGDKRTNGCREIFAIELPWIVDTFGEVVKVDIVKDKISNLEIDYNDNYMVILQHETGHKGVLLVDVVSRKSVRNLEVFGEGLHLNWDGTPTGLDVYDFVQKETKKLALYKEVDQLANYSSFVVENAYASEIAAFFDAVLDKKEARYTFKKDKQILELIDRIEE